MLGMNFSFDNKEDSKEKTTMRDENIARMVDQLVKMFPDDPTFAEYIKLRGKSMDANKESLLLLKNYAKEISEKKRDSLFKELDSILFLETECKDQEAALMDSAERFAEFAKKALDIKKQHDCNSLIKDFDNITKSFKNEKSQQ